MRSVYLLVIAAAVAVTISLILQVIFYNHASRVTLINNASEAVVEARLTQTDREFAFGAIEPGESRSIDFVPREDSASLKVTFRSGGEWSIQNLGYLTDAGSVDLVVEVTDTGVELLARNIVENAEIRYSNR